MIDEIDKIGSDPPLSSPAPTHRETRVKAFTIDKMPVWFKGIMGSWDDWYNTIMDNPDLNKMKMNGENYAAGKAGFKDAISEETKRIWRTR